MLLSEQKDFFYVTLYIITFLHVFANVLQITMNPVGIYLYTYIFLRILSIRTKQTRERERNN